MNPKYHFTYTHEPATIIYLREVIATEVLSDAIEGTIINGLDYLSNHPSESIWFSLIGNTLILLSRDEDEVQIEVAERKRSAYTKVKDRLDDYYPED